MNIMPPRGYYVLEENNESFMAVNENGHLWNEDRASGKVFDPNIRVHSVQAGQILSWAQAREIAETTGVVSGRITVARRGRSTRWKGKTNIIATNFPISRLHYGEHGWHLGKRQIPEDLVDAILDDCEHMTLFINWITVPRGQTYPDRPEGFANILSFSNDVVLVFFTLSGFINVYVRRNLGAQKWIRNTIESHVLDTKVHAQPKGQILVIAKTMPANDPKWSAFTLNLKNGEIQRLPHGIPPIIGE